MTRTLKLFGLGLLVVSALSVTVANAEVSSPAVFTASVGAGETAKGVGEQIGTSEFKIGTLPPMTCATAKGSGKALSKGPSFEKVTIEAFGETCHVVLPLIGTKGITITANGCAAVFIATTTETKGVKSFTADEETECPPGKGVEVHVYNNAAHTETLCTYEIPPQNHGSEGKLENKAGTPTDVVAAGTVKGITVKRIAGIESLCGPQNNTATATGEITIRATSEAGVFVNGSVSG